MSIEKNRIKLYTAYRIKFKKTSIPKQLKVRRDDLIPHKIVLYDFKCNILSFFLSFSYTLNKKKKNYFYLKTPTVVAKTRINR